MAVVANLAGGTPLDLKYSSPNRTAANLTAVLALTPTYPGEIALALDTGALYRGLATVAGRWGYVGPPADIVPGVPPAPDVTPPTVSITQNAGQADPTSVSPILFDVVFSETVTGFGSSDVDLTASTAGGTLVAVVTGSGATYSVSVSGMTTDGDVTATVPAAVCSDTAGNSNAAAPSPATVAWVGTPVVPGEGGLTYYFLGF